MLPIDAYLFSYWQVLQAIQVFAGVVFEHWVFLGSQSFECRRLLTEAAPWWRKRSTGAQAQP